MCGIFGIAVADSLNLESKQFNRMLKDLFVLSESRGKEAAGVALSTRKNIEIQKGNIAASEFIRTKDYKAILKKLPEKNKRVSDVLCIGHSRLVTNGAADVNENNQPICRKGIIYCEKIFKIIIYFIFR